MQSDLFHTAASEAIAALDLVPDTMLAIIVALLAVSIALIVHRVVFGALRRIATSQHPRLQPLLAQTRGPARFALVLLALALVVPLTPINPDWSVPLARALQLAFILLLGWTALALANAGAEIYLSGFKLDDQNNLLARKHIT